MRIALRIFGLLAVGSVALACSSSDKPTDGDSTNTTSVGASNEGGADGESTNYGGGFEVGGGSGIGGTSGLGGEAGVGGSEPLPPGCDGGTAVGFGAAAKSPADNATVTGTSVDLEVSVDGELVADATAKFFVREVHPLTDADDFTIIVLPDTQNYTQFPGNFPQYQAQTKWIWDHRASDNIVAVLHNGDIVQHGNSVEEEWKRAETAMKTIEPKVTKFPDGMPYGMAVGNHDNGSYAHDDTPFATTFFNKYFGIDRFKDRGYYGGHYGNKNDNNWIMVKAGNLDVVMVSFEYRGTLGQDPKVLDWGMQVFKDHPNALGIVNSHYIVNGVGNFGSQGKEIYNGMKKVKNVQLMTSGHIKAKRRRRTDTFQGHTIHSMLADYQDMVVKADNCAGGCGYMRIWKFSPKTNKLSVKSYSPSENKFLTSNDEQFTLDVDMSKAKGVFEPAGSVSGIGKALTYKATALKPKTSYEWYAVVDECGDKVTTATRKFKTQ